MAFAASNSAPDRYGPADPPRTDTRRVKLVVAGGLGVGKTTLIRSVSEIRSLHTEEVMTAPSARTDSLLHTPGKTHTTVSMDFGRVAVADDIALYLFGTPGQARFRQAWEDTVYGARGALVLLDLRRPDASYEAMGLVEEAGMPYAACINLFDGAPHYATEDIRSAFDLDDATPLLTCDARDRNSSLDALINLVTHAITRYRQELPA